VAVKPPDAAPITVRTRVRRFVRDDGWRSFLHDGPRLTAWTLGTTLAMHLIYVMPLTHELAEDILAEDSIVEDITAVALLLAAGLGVLLAVRAKRQGRPLLVWGFYLAVAIVVFLIGMEEISWGQWIFFWKTPETFKEINAQGETNLHNIGPLEGHSEYFRFAFIAAAVLGVFLRRRPRFREIATPPSLTGPLLVILAYVMIDLIDDFFPSVPWIITTFSSMSEWDEMLIGLACLAFVVLKREQYNGPRAVPA